MLSNALAYYSQHSTITHPGDYAALLDNLPTDLPSLHQVVQNVLIHVWKIRKFHKEFLQGRTHEYELRGIAPLLEQIQAFDRRPLTVERPIEKKLIVDCRHFATLLCAILRQQQVPARVRCGFATYLEDTHYQDHWVCEFWNGERWVLEDPDLMMHDVSREQFMTGGKAWRLARAGEVSADRFGYDPNACGLWCVRDDLMRDLAALNGFEALSADGWGKIGQDNLVESDMALLDQAAAMTLADNAAFADMRAFYDASPSLRVPNIITVYNYITDELRTVRLDG